MSDNTGYGDIGIDLTEEDEQIFDKVRAEMPEMTPEEEAIYLKELKRDIDASKHPIKLL
jgi:hypothetical protein